MLAHPRTSPRLNPASQGGPNPSGALAEVNIPAACPALQGDPETDWAYRTVPQKEACLGLKGNVSFWPMGKVLGGSSSINYMAYVRGAPSDFDSWAAQGATGWDYKSVRECKNLREIPTPHHARELAPPSRGYGEVDPAAPELVPCLFPPHPPPPPPLPPSLPLARLHCQALVTHPTKIQ